jgi:predicted aminopeptidase
MIHARPAAAAVLVLAALTLGGCSPGYFLQAAGGQLEVARARRPVSSVLADPATAPAVRGRLLVAADAVGFAHRELALPDNGSFREFADLGRTYVVWNVFAAPEFALELRRWCFPVAGCVAYRGYFAEEDARVFAARLAGRGDDVHVGGALAYSTLGFFRDPLLGGALGLGDAALAGLVFHELAHQQVYAAGDTVFNESFATLVEQEGTLRWLAARGDERSRCGFADALAREAEVHRLLDDTRARLASIYAAPADAPARRAAKEAEIARMRERYRALRADWPRPSAFDRWFEGPINNATLGALAAYDQLVDTLRVILEGEAGDLAAFYRRAARLARLNAADRAAVLREIARPSAMHRPAGCGG